MLRTRHLLATLAMHLGRARKSERRLNPSFRSIVHDIRNIEDLGVYHLLCSIDVALVSEEFQDLDAHSNCDEPANRALSDNRTYLILHSLDQYLAVLGDKFAEFRQ